jgi:hypothetical protein
MIVTITITLSILSTLLMICYITDTISIAGDLWSYAVVALAKEEVLLVLSIILLTIVIDR